MISIIFEVCLLLVIFVLMLTIWRMGVRARERAEELEQLSFSVAGQQNQVDVMKAYVCDDVLIWYAENNDRLDEVPVIDDAAVILIKGEHLKMMYEKRWNEGYALGHANSFNGTNFQVPATSNTLDGHYRDHVNELREIAIHFHNQGQLRARIADKVMGFRQNLCELQKGTKLIFPNGPSAKGRPVLPKRPKSSKEEGTWSQF